MAVAVGGFQSTAVYMRLSSQTGREINEHILCEWFITAKSGTRWTNTKNETGSLSHSEIAKPDYNKQEMLFKHTGCLSQKEPSHKHREWQENPVKFINSSQYSCLLPSTWQAAPWFNKPTHCHHHRYFHTSHPSCSVEWYLNVGLPVLFISSVPPQQFVLLSLCIFFSFLK